MLLYEHAMDTSRNQWTLGIIMMIQDGPTCVWCDVVCVVFLGLVM